MNRILLFTTAGLLLALAATDRAHAASSTGIVVTNCGTPPVTYVAGQPAAVTVDTGGNQCISGSITVNPITNYELESGGNADLQTNYLLLLKNAIGTPIPSNKHCQTTAVAATLTCGAPATALIDFSVTPDATLSAAAYFVMIFDATSVPAPGAVTPAMCYAVPSTFGAQSYGATFGAGGVTLTTGLSFAVSVGANCQTYTASTHAGMIRASYQ